MSDGPKASDEPQHGPSGSQEFDWVEMLQRLQPPGVDLEALKNRASEEFEALRQANQAVANGFATLAEKPGEIFQSAREALRTAADERRLPLPQEGFDAARELAEIALKPQSEVAAIIRQRIQVNLESLFKQPDGGGDGEESAAGGGGAQSDESPEAGRTGRSAGAKGSARSAEARHIAQTDD